MRTFSHDCNRLIKRPGNSRMGGRIVAGSFVDLLGAKKREHLSDEIGDVHFGGECKYAAFECIRD